MVVTLVRRAAGQGSGLPPCPPNLRCAALPQSLLAIDRGARRARRVNLAKMPCNCLSVQGVRRLLRPWIERPVDNSTFLEAAGPSKGESPPLQAPSSFPYRDDERAEGATEDSIHRNEARTSSSSVHTVRKRRQHANHLP